jgi:hypothetical protein
LHKIIWCLLLTITARLAFAQTISPTSNRRLDERVSSVAWLDSTHVVVAGPSGVRKLSLVDKTSTEVISTKPVPHGLPDPLAVTSDGKSVVASNGFTRSHFAASVETKRRLFGRSSPLFLAIDVAVSGENLYLLGWPADVNGVNNGAGVAVWKGGLNSHFETFQPLHRIQSGPRAVAIFNDSLPVYGGALAVESDGTLDVMTAAEPGIFQYTPDGVLRHRLGARLGELVMRRMHDINFTFGDDPVGRYRNVVNRQPVIDDLVATADGPAIVVRTVKDDVVQWELWYPNDDRIDRRVKLNISRRGPFGHLSCDARSRDLVCVYQSPSSAQEALNTDESKLPTFLVQFDLPAPVVTPARTASSGGRQ